MGGFCKEEKMEYRECRQNIFLELFSEVSKTISLQKQFLLLGGIRAAVYVTRKDNIPIFVPTGFAKIHYPSILQRFNIEYEKERINEFLDKTEKKKLYEGDFFYIAPFNDSMLRTRDYKSVNHELIGDSQLLIHELECDTNKIIFAYGKDVQNYWIDMNVYREVEKNIKLFVSNEFCVYKISKEKLRKNKTLRRKIELPLVELLNRNAEAFFVEEKREYYENTFRLDGLGSYRYLMQNYQNLKKVYLSSTDSVRKMQILTYITMCLKEFKRFVTVGSEANYRNEFVDVLQVCDRKGEVDLKTSIEEWKNITLRWNRIIMELTKVLAKEKTEESVLTGISVLIEFLSTICDAEEMGMRNLRNKLRL